MIDTIVMILPRGKFTIYKPEMFQPNANIMKRFVLNNSNGEQRCICNPTRRQREKGYYPRLTLSRRFFVRGGFEIKLKIELSLPKLLFQNNFDELEDKDFDLIVSTLLTRLDEMGVEVKRETLEGGFIRKVDYSKNIVLDQPTTSSMILNELNKLNLNKKLDLTQTKFRNEGQSLTFHSNNFELTFYDKVKDMEQSKKFGEKRSREIDNKYRPDLFNYVDYRKKFDLKHFEVLRFEGRFGRVKLKSIFKKLNIKNELTFRELYNKEIAKKVLLFYWQDILKESYILHYDLDDISNLIATIKETFSRATGNKICKLVGAIGLIQKLGSRGARIELNISNPQWYRLQKELKQINSNKKNHKFLAIGEFGDKLEKFDSVKLKDYELDFLNNNKDVMKQ